MRRERVQRARSTSSCTHELDAATSATSATTARTSSPKASRGRVVDDRGEAGERRVRAAGHPVGDAALNEFKVGYNAAHRTSNGVAPTVNGIDLSNLTLNTQRQRGQHRHRRPGCHRPASPIPGGLVRQNSATNGRGAPYDPYSLSFIDTLTQLAARTRSSSAASSGMIRMDDRPARRHDLHLVESERLPGQPAAADPVPRRPERSRARSTTASPASATPQQDYYIGYAQDEWRAGAELTLNYGLRYEYYTPLRERDDLHVLFDTVTRRAS